MRADRASAIGSGLADLDDLVLTVDEAARALRISRSLAFAAVRAGTIPSLRIGRRILVPKDALHALIAGPAAPQKNDELPDLS